MKQEFLEMLLKAHKLEYTDVFLYDKEAKLFREKVINGEKISDVFNEYSNMELTHADILANQIRLLGAVPTWEFYNIETNESLIDSLKLHMEREVKAYNMYKDIIKNNDDRHFKIILQGIMAEEKLHLETATEYLKLLESSRYPKDIGITRHNSDKSIQNNGE